jgi:dephospho-CoA kinase
LAFNNPDVLKELETIIHPLVEGAIDLMIRRAGQRIIVIEAIKLLEGKLFNSCDAIWVTYSPESLQLARLMQKRGMKEQEAFQRIRVQPSQESKISAANVVIKNIGSFEDTWKQVVAAWKGFSPVPEIAPVAVQRTGIGELAVLRGRPRDSSDIAGLITRLSGGTRRVTSDDVMAAFGDKAFLLLKVDGKLLGIAGWKVENLVARIDEIYVDQSLVFAEAAVLMVNEIERVSRDLQCEVSLLFLPQELTAQEPALAALGYERRSVKELGVQPWEEAALESMPAGSKLLFKKLREDRILRPV